MKIAYLIIVHSDPRQLVRLVKTLPDDSPVFIHVDARAPATIYNQMTVLLASRPQTRFSKRFACRWGDIGIVRATVELIRLATESDFDYATLLSGADYPIKSNEAIAEFLKSAGSAEHIEAANAEDHVAADAQDGLYRADLKLRRFHVRIRSKVLPTRWVRKMPYGLTAYTGSQWWTLSRQAILYINQYNANNPSFMRFAAKSFIPDESVIQTILGNSPFRSLITGDNLRCVIWDRPEPPYPAILKMDDLPFLSSCADLFARKFAPAIDDKILDALDLLRSDSADL